MVQVALASSAQGPADDGVGSFSKQWTGCGLSSLEDTVPNVYYLIVVLKIGLSLLGI